MKAIGVCIGASSIKMAIIEKNILEIKNIESKSIPHLCNPQKNFLSIVKELSTTTIDYGMITGRKFREKINHTSITEAESIEYALDFLRKAGNATPYKAVASLGAENFIVYNLNNSGNISSIETGNKCASGTGEFFLQQIRRMNVDISEAVNLARESDIYKVSGRCSVFCKSDCTHALNKGVPVGRVCAGLCSMIADKIIDLLGRNISFPILAIGGVTRNHAVMHFLKKKVPFLTIPEFADTFEALGAAFYALENRHEFSINKENIFNFNNSSYNLHCNISNGHNLVSFKSDITAQVHDNDQCIVGLDVGSTTTKAVLMRLSDNAIVASVYLRTNGNPIKASQECYKALEKQLSVNCSILAIGTTGSGRQIAALHAQTPAVVNEIIAHAAAAAFYDPEVDTIFEIGGQDAKYTFLVNGVPADYAMNEACSAGTGSFLEEAAKESLNIDYKDIADIALRGTNPPDFNDQCAAFISSDIKNATNECIDRENIVAGLVYSICLNYVNRVKGQRPVGKKIFMQGGVCYNNAVPLAMANLIGKEIIVPPNPGLMGAFGVALETKSLLTRGLLKKSSFDLHTLANRDVTYGKSFICNDLSSKCNRKCEISMLIFDNKKYPFGGACNKYYNMVFDGPKNSSEFNFVKTRNDLLFDTFSSPDPKNASLSVGIPKSFLTYLLLPLYSHFFTSLGCKVILSDNVNHEGIKYKRTSYCFPGEVSHGNYFNLLLKKPDFIFLPKVTELFVENSQSRKPEHQSTCLLLQSEPYFIKSAFKEIKNKPQTLSPLLDFSQGFDSQKEAFINMGLILGKSASQSADAYNKGIENLKIFNKSLKEIGLKFLHNLQLDNPQTAIVLFGRPYNAFANEVNLNIPEKFASRGIHLIPWDILPFENEELNMDMCWALGQNLMKASAFVSKHQQLFGTYITNFSCGPDSFLITYFRDIMGSKPSLTLELDSHTADAGVNTRIDAFLDIINKHKKSTRVPAVKSGFSPASLVIEKGEYVFSGKNGVKLPITDKKVHLLFPSMGALSSEIIASVFYGSGIRASSIPVYNMDVLKKGRSVSSCKECLPLLLTTGGLLNYLENRENNDEFVVYFMPTTPGNCRFTQYHVFQERLIEKLRFENVAFLSLTNENGYSGLSTKCMLNSLKGLIIADIMDDIKNAINVLAKDKECALDIFSRHWQIIINLFKNGRDNELYSTLHYVSGKLSEIPLKYPISEAKKIDLHGEIFVRRDDFSCLDLLKHLANNEIIVKRAHTLEWLNYCDWNVQNGIYKADFNIMDWFKFKAKDLLGRRYENKIKGIFSKSGLYEFEPVNINTIINYGKQFFDIHFSGESILVVGSFFKNIIKHSYGLISIGPFACMPTRIIDAILSAEASMETKLILDNNLGLHNTSDLDLISLPFLSIETDGNPFPQIVETRIEAFCLQVDRLWKALKESKHSDSQLLKTNF